MRRGEAGIGLRTRVTISAIEKHPGLRRASRTLCPGIAAFAFLHIAALTLFAQSSQSVPVPPRVEQAHRFLAERGPRNRATSTPRPAGMARATDASAPSTAIWQPLGPQAVLTSNYGLVTGRVASIAIDPSDPTGNRVFLGTTGGGVWRSQN